jgi:regulator of sigma E protease
MIFQYGIPFLIILGILVFVHEFGHYYAARLNNVKVDVFSIGFGKELFGWNDAHGTRWRFSLIPLGGYVKLYGDADETSRPDLSQLNEMSPLDKDKSLHGKHPLQKISVSIAGPLANFLLAIVVLTGLFSTVGKPLHAPIISNIHPQTPAEAAGLQKDDKIISVNNKNIHSFEEVTKIIEEFGENPLHFVIERQQQSLSLDILPKKIAGGPIGKNTYLIGIGAQQMVYEKHSVLNAFPAAVQYVGEIIKSTVKLFVRLFSGNSLKGEIGGPLRIAQMAGQAMESGIADFLSLLALLSISLGFINLLPVPMLDGGHVLLYSIEWALGRPLSEKAQENAYRLGMIFVGGLMLLSFWNDLKHLKIIEFFLKFF